MVGIVVVSHSARLAAGVVELAREMAGEVRLVPAGGLEPPAADEPAPLGTDAGRVLAAIEQADDGTGDGVVVLMDLGSAVLSAETARDLLDPDVADRVELCAAPLVEGAVAAAVAAQAGQPRAAVADEARGGLAAKAAHLGQPATVPGAAGASAHGPARSNGAPDADASRERPAPTVEERFVVTVSQGLHARPAARFVRTAAAFDADVELENATTGAGPVPAGSLNAIATLGVREGHEVVVRASGPDADRAVARLRAVATAAAPVSSDRARPPADEAERPAPDDAAVSAAEEAEVAAPAARPLPPDAPSGALAGIASSPGVALAPLRPLGSEAELELPDVPDAPAGDPEQEWAALRRARDAVRGEIETRRERLASDVGAEEAEILDALVLVLDDDAVLGPARAAVFERRASAARAWLDAVEAIADRYRALEDAYQRERAEDVLDVGRRVALRLLAADADRRGATGAGASASAAADAAAREPAIVIARELTPLDAAALDPATVAAIATAGGGPTSHGAILARALGVPAVVGLGPAVLELAPGTRAVLDGDRGLLIPSPDADVERAYAERRRRAAADAERARAVAADPATTRDGVRIEVAANAGEATDAAVAVAAGADGIGLLRTEFAFLDRDRAPTEGEQAEQYAAAAAALDGRPLIIRTLDAGADKPLPYLGMPAEDNPFLGVRGLRLGLARPRLLATQLRAVLRTAAAHANVKLMFPMVATVDELRAARALLDEARAAVADPPREGFEVGIMVEVPAAALTARQLAREVDFFSIGTNDLTQYVLAAERGNAALAPLADGLHPAVLRLIAQVCDAAAEHGRWVGVCGELGADLAAVPLLVGLGVRELSVAPPSVAAVKARVRELDTDAAAALARRALAAPTAAAVRSLVSEPGIAGRG